MSDIEKLHELESQKVITVGLHRNAANNFWYRSSILGKILNLGTTVLLLLCIYVFYAFGWKVGCLSLLGLALYVKAIQWFGFASVRIQMLADEALFNLFYQSGAATVRVNTTGEIVRHPTDWRQVLA